jgi:hypothetical protein
MAKCPPLAGGHREAGEKEGQRFHLPVFLPRLREESEGQDIPSQEPPGAGDEDRCHPHIPTCPVPGSGAHCPCAPLQGTITVPAQEVTGPCRRTARHGT